MAKHQVFTENNSFLAGSAIGFLGHFWLFLDTSGTLKIEVAKRALNVTSYNLADWNLDLHNSLFL